MDETETTTPPRKAARKSSSRRPKRKTPPANVQPGAIHDSIAAFLLDSLKARTADKIGMPLEVGDLSEANTALTGNPAVGEEGREPVELLARILAHVGHRIPFFSRVEKKLEGKDAKSGLLADITAFVVQLVQRNRHLVPIVLEAAQQSRKSPPPSSPATYATHATGSVANQPEGVQ